MNASDRKNNQEFEISLKYSKNTHGNLKIICNGNMILSSRFYLGLITLAFINACSIFFIVYVIKRAENINEKIIVIAIESILLLVTLVFCFRTTFSNPGIIPNNSFEKENMENHILAKNEYKLILSRGYFFRYKFCKTCLIIRPQGSSHCRICNICIERYDHHCPWVGNCIGMNNYNSFFIFIGVFSLMLCFNLIVSLNYFIKDHALNGFDTSSVFYEVVGIVGILITVINLIFVAVLFMYHVWFSLGNKTTYINVRMADVLYVFGNPFSKNSIKKNLQYVFCSKKIERIKQKENLPLNTLENYLSAKDNILKQHLHKLKFDLKGSLVKGANSKFLNRSETLSITKKLIKLSKFSRNTEEEKKSINELNYANNRSEIKNLISDGTPIEINISNTMEKYKLNNCDSKINLISKFKSCRVKRNSEFINEFVLTNQKSKSDFLDNS